MRLICMLIQDMFIILGSIVSTFGKACEITYRERWILLQWPTINLLSIIPHFGLEMSIVVIHNCWPNHKYHHLNFQFWQFLIQSKRSKACVELESWVEICTCHNPKCVYIYIYIHDAHLTVQISTLLGIPVIEPHTINMIFESDSRNNHCWPNCKDDNFNFW